jgi:hypothetical protein
LVVRCGLLVALLGAVVLPAGAAAQTGGAIAGRVTDAVSGVPIPGARVEVGRGQYGALTDADGRYRVREVRPGVHRVTVRAVGYRPVLRDSLMVTGGATVVLDVQLAPEAVELPGIAVEAEPDPLLDPRIAATVQQVTAADLRELPVTSLEEAIALKAGVVQASIRGGRAGQDVLVLDGMPIKNQLDAASGPTGVAVPAIALREATLVTNGFSAQYGQALSGMVTAVTREGGDRLEGTLAFETDRPLGNGWDYGLDRLVAALGGPLFGGLRFFVALDAQGRLDHEPVNAPPPTDPLDPRHLQPWVLPHNAGERYDLFGKLTVPAGVRSTIRVQGALSRVQRQLFDPVLKYQANRGPAERVGGGFAMAHFQHVTRPEAATQVVMDLRASYFEKEAHRAPLLTAPTFRLGAFTFSRWDLAGEQVARNQDTVTALGRIPGFAIPAFAEQTPWGVPGFFMTDSPRGELAWNRFREGRARLDVFLGPGRSTDIRLGGEYVTQQVRTFTRLEAYETVARGAPAPVSSAFTPFQASGYGELVQRLEDVAFTVGFRLDAFNPRAQLDTTPNLPTKVAMGPRVAFSTVLQGALVVASWGRFAQPPDYQYLTDAAFDDTLRTGRFRRGNPGLGFETATQYELQVRVRPSLNTGIRAGAYVRRLDGLVASVPVGVDVDSAVFGNADFADVRGIEFSLERDFVGTWGASVSYVLQQAEATATNAEDFFRRLQITPVGDTVLPAAVTFPLDFDRRHALIVTARGRIPRGAGPVLSGFEGGVVFRWGSGLPYSRTTPGGDSIIGAPNSERLPDQYALDLLLRRAFRLGGVRLGVYVDVRNVTNRRNVVAVRRESGTPFAGAPQIEEAALDAYAANPAPIPYESPRYRPDADLDGDGLLVGEEELLPLYRRAAQDFLHPVFAYGPPRLLRLGVEVSF